VYVGNLDKGCTDTQLEDVFSRYGKLKNVWVARAPPGFAFVEFEKAVDAEDACKELDGQDICGARVRVEMSSGKSRPKPFNDRGRRGGGGGGGGYRGGGRYGDEMKCYECNRVGHIARDCPIRHRSSRRYSRSRSRSPRRSRYSRSRSRDRY